MFVVDQIVKQCDIAFVDLFFELAERHSRGVDDGCLRTEMVDQSDPSLPVKDLYMIFGGNVEMLDVAHFTFPVLYIMIVFPVLQAENSLSSVGTEPRSRKNNGFSGSSSSSGV